MYQNTVALPRLDLLGAIRTEDLSLDDYIAHQVLPVMPVDKPAGNVPRVLITDDQILSLKRGPKTAFQRFEGSADSVGYSCQSSGIEEPMSAEDYAVLGQDRAEQNATTRSMHAVLRARDYALAAATTGSTGETLFSGQVTTAGSSGIAWDNASGVPITDVANADLELTTRIGAGKRTLIISYAVLNKLQINAQIRSTYRNIAGINDKKETFRKLSIDSLAMVLGVEKILVGAGRYNSATKGQTAVKAFIWPSNYAILTRSCDNPGDLQEPVLGRLFSWDQADAEIVSGSIDQSDPLHGLMIETYRDEPIDSDVVRAKEYTDPKILNLKAAQLIKSL